MNGLSVVEIAAKHKISTASFYRWWRQQNNFTASADVFKEFDIAVSEAIAIINDWKSHEAWTLRDAIFRLAVWIRWPHEPHTQRNVLANCVSQYLRKTARSPDITLLETQARRILFKYIDLDFLSVTTSIWAPFAEMFELRKYGAAAYTELDFFAQLTHYILSPEAVLAERTSRVNLSKMYELVESSVFGPDWVMSKRTLQKIWSQRAASFPFLYVERYNLTSGVHVDWTLDPEATEFPDEIDAIQANLQDIKRYIAHCRWVIEELKTRLDPRSLQAISFPRFPVNLAPEPLAVTGYTPRQVEKIRRATKGK